MKIAIPETEELNHIHAGIRETFSRLKLAGLPDDDAALQSDILSLEGRVYAKDYGQLSQAWQARMIAGLYPVNC